MIGGPLDLLDTLIDKVNALNLPNGLKNSLLAKLTAAQNKLSDGNPNNDGAAVGMLTAFINQVQAQSGKKIEVGDANDCIDKAQDIIDLLLGA